MSVDLDRRLNAFKQLRLGYEAVLSDQLTLLESQHHLNCARRFKEKPGDPLVEEQVALNHLQDLARQHVLKCTREDYDLMFRTLHPIVRRRTRPHHPQYVTPYELPGRSAHAKLGDPPRRWVMMRVPTPPRHLVDNYFSWVLEAHQVAEKFYCFPAVAAVALWVQIESLLQGDRRRFYRRVDTRPADAVLETTATLFNFNSEVYFTVSKAYEAASKL